MSLPLDLAARLWLAEPDQAALDQARPWGLTSDASPEELAGGYTALFVLNVYPYGSVFTDPAAELNGNDSLIWARRFEETAFRPDELVSVGAPDHLGLCLKYLHHCETRGVFDAPALSRTLSWGPVCTLAAERDPLADEFYRQLARATREALLERCAGSAAESTESTESAAPEEGNGDLEGTGDNGELRLSDVLSFLLAPARCGFFLSRSALARLGRRVALPVPFGGRFETARGLFESAGESGRVEELLDQIAGQIDLWEQSYARTAAAFPAWTSRAEPWRTRLTRCRKALATLRAAVRDFDPSFPSETPDARGAKEA